MSPRFENGAPFCLQGEGLEDFKPVATKMRPPLPLPFILKADSHIACRALIHTCHAVPLPCSNSSVSFVKVRVVAGNIRTASPTV